MTVNKKIEGMLLFETGHEYDWKASFDFYIPKSESIFTFSFSHKVESTINPRMSLSSLVDLVNIFRIRLPALVKTAGLLHEICK